MHDKKKMIIKNYLPGSLKKNFPIAHGSRWYIEYYTTGTRSGGHQRHRKTFNLNRIHDYQERIAEGDRIFSILESVNTNSGQTCSKNPISISECIQKAILIKQSKTDRSKSVTTFTSIASLFLSWLRAQYLADVDPHLVDRRMAIAFLDQAVIDRGISPTTHNNYINILRNIFNVMIERGYIETNPFSRIPELRPDQKLRRPLSDYEKKIIMEEIRREGDIFLEIAVGFIYYTLIRPIELRRLRFRDVDLQRGMVTMSGIQTKNHKNAKLTMDANFTGLLHRLGFHRYPPDFLIFGRGGIPHQSMPVGEHTLNNRHHKILLQLKKKYALDVSGISLYSWKDTGATDLLERGVTINELRQHIRHDDLKDTQRYLRQFTGVNERIRDIGLTI